MTKYTKDEIWLMDEMEFANIFQVNRYAIVTLDNNLIIEGRIQEIGVAANPNMNVHEHAPVSIKIVDESISIQSIKEITVC